MTRIAIAGAGIGGLTVALSLHAMGFSVTGFAQADDKVTVLFGDRSSYEADLLIGADGLPSKVRSQMHPNEGPLCYDGTMMFRGTTETAAIGDGRTMVIAAEFPMIDRDPLPFWTDGRVTLLGDAAHPMYPIGANGARQAIIDRRALAEALAADAGPGGLRAYEAARRPVATNVVPMNRKGGPEQVLDIADARVNGPEDRIEDLITPGELEEVAANYRAIAGFQKRTA